MTKTMNTTKTTHDKILETHMKTIRYISVRWLGSKNTNIPRVMCIAQERQNRTLLTLALADVREVRAERNMV